MKDFGNHGEMISQDDGWFEWLLHFQRTIQESARGVLLLLSRDCSKSLFRAKLLILVEFCQMCAFPLWKLLRGNVHDQHQPSWRIAVYAVDWGKIAFAVLGSWTSVLTSVVLVLLLLCNATYAGYAWSHSKLNVVWPLKTLRSLAGFCFGLAFIPLVKLMALVNRCEDLGTQSWVSCDVFRPTTWVLTFFFVLMALLVASTYHDPHLNSKSPYASAHTRVTVVHFLCKIVLSYTHSVWTEEQSNVYALELARHMMLVVCSALLVYLYVWYQPYFSFEMNTYGLISSGVLFWISLSVTAQFLIPSSTLQPDIFWGVALTGSCFIIVLAPLLLRWRQERLKHIPVFRLRNSFEFELKMRLMLQENRTLRGLGENIETFPLMKIRPDAFGAEENHDGMESDQLKADVLQKQVGNQYEYAVKQFSNCSNICLFHVYFLRSFLPKVRASILSRKSLQCAMSRRKLFDVEFELYKLDSEMRYNVSSGKEALSFVTCEKYERDAKQFDKKTCFLLVEFWNEFEHSTLDLAKIESLSKGIAELTTKANAAYAQLMRLQPGSSRVMDIYGDFLLNIANDKVKGEKLLLKASMMGSGDVANSQFGSSRDARSSKGVLTFEIGDNPGMRFGEITDMNMDGARVLNSNTQAMIGKNVEFVFVEPLRSQLVEVVQKFFEFGTHPLFDQPFETHCLTSSGSIFFAEVTFSPFTLDGVHFAVQTTFKSIENIPPHIDFSLTTGYVLTSTKGEIYGACEDTGRILDSLPRAVGISCLHLSEILEDYNDSLRETLFQSDKMVPVKARGNSDSELYASIKSHEINNTVVDQVFLSYSCPSEELEREIGTYDMTRDDGFIASKDGFGIYQSRNSLGTMSESSGSSGNTVSHIRTVLSSYSTGKQLLPTLQQLTRKYLFMLFIVMCISIGFFYIERSKVAEFAENIAFLNKAGFRRYNSVSIAYGVHALVLKNKGYNLPEFMTEETAREIIADNANKLRIFEYEAFEKRGQSETLTRIYTTSTTKLLSFHNDRVVVDYLSLQKATSKVSALALQLSEQPLEAFTTENPNVYMLMNMINTDDDVLDYLNKTTSELMDTSVSSIGQLIPLFTVSFVIAILLPLTLLVVSILPLLRDVQRKKYEVLALLAGIPNRNIESIKHRFKARLVDVHETAQEIMQSLDSHALSSKHGKKKKKKQDGVKTVKWENLSWWERLRKCWCSSRKKPMIAVGPSVEAGNAEAFTETDATENKPVQMSSSVGTQVGSSWTIFSMGLPGILACLYYAVIYVLGFYSHTKYVVAISESANYAGLRRATLRLFQHKALLMLFGTTFSHGDQMFQSGIQNVSQVAESFERVDNHLFNSAKAGLLNFESYQLQQKTLMLQDSCFGWRENELLLTKENCTGFNGGSMGGGLQNAVIKYIDDMFEQCEKIKNSSDQHFENENIHVLLKLEKFYLQPQLTTSVLIYVNDVTAFLTDSDGFRNLALGVFITCLLLSHVVSTLPIIQNLDKELKRTRLLLLLVPDEVYSSLAGLREFLTREASNMNN